MSFKYLPRPGVVSSFVVGGFIANLEAQLWVTQGRACAKFVKRR